MKGLEDRRMNFLKMRQGAFTYRSMLLILIGWGAFLCIFYAFLFLREMSVGGDVSVAKKAIEKLTEQKNRQLELLSVLGKENMGTATQDDLTAILAKRVLWSRVLKALARDVPPQMWLESIEVKQEKDGEPKLDIRVKAKSQRALSSFIMQLESGGAFKQTELASAKMATVAGGFFEYEIFTVPVMKKFQQGSF
ncbi:MAG: PilN domain-containing protein [Pseudomonadota bacterium]